MELTLVHWRVGALAASAVLNLTLATALLVLGRPPERRLAGVLVVLTGIMTPYVLIVSGVESEAPWYLWLPNLPLALGPLLWSYIRVQTRGVESARLWPHLIPAAAHLAWRLLLIGLFLTGSLHPLLADFHEGWAKDAFDAAALISLAAYSWASLREVAAYRRWLAQNRSDADRYAAVWFSRLILALLALLAVLAPLRAYTWFIDELDAVHVFALYAVLAVFAAYAGIEGWRCSERRFPAMTVDPVIAPAGRDWAAQGGAWRETILDAGWWREPDLSAATLARRLGTNTAYLSRAFNEGLGLNFAETINGMRAEAVAARLQAGERLNLLEIAFEAGFSSKASFNRAFRAAYGMSPSAYAAQFQRKAPTAEI